MNRVSTLALVAVAALSCGALFGPAITNVVKGQSSAAEDEEDTVIVIGESTSGSSNSRRDSGYTVRDADDIRAEVADIKSKLVGADASSEYAQRLQKRLRYLEDVLRKEGDEARLIEFTSSGERPEYVDTGMDAQLPLSPEDIGSYTIQRGGRYMYLLDSRTGDSWYLSESDLADGRGTWKPVRHDLAENGNLENSIRIDRFLEQLPAYRDLKQQLNDYSKTYDQQMLAMEEKVRTYENLVMKRLRESVNLNMDDYVEEINSNPPVESEDKEESDLEKAMREINKALEGAGKKGE